VFYLLTLNIHALMLIRFQERFTEFYILSSDTANNVAVVIAGDGVSILNSKNYCNPQWAIFSCTCVAVTAAATALLFFERVLSRCYPHFMDPRDSVLCSHDSTNKFYSEFRESNPTSYIFHTHFRIILFMINYPKWSLPQNVFNESACFSHLC